MSNPVEPKTTAAYFVQSVIAFVLAVAAVGIGLWNMPGDVWVRGFLAVAFLFTVTTTFTLSKVIRDRQETGSVLSRLDAARLERMLAEYDVTKSPELQLPRTNTQHQIH